jgi:hypothetical protein
MGANQCATGVSAYICRPSSDTNGWWWIEVFVLVSNKRYRIANSREGSKKLDDGTALRTSASVKISKKH